MSLAWDFGDSTQRTDGADTAHTYADAGTFTVQASSGGRTATVAVAVPHGDLPPPTFDDGPVFMVIAGFDSLDLGMGGPHGIMCFTTSDPTDAAEAMNGMTIAWPTGPGVTMAIDWRLDGGPVTDLALPIAGGDLMPVPPATADDLTQVWTVPLIGFQAPALRLAPGPHLFTVVGLDEHGAELWELAMPYIVVPDADGRGLEARGEDGLPVASLSGPRS